MDYLALYRKYRPQRFAEIVGQDHVTETLIREVQADRVAHAYLFAGPRGTGKTSTARIIAKALNCTDRRPDGEPCNECASCISIADGSSLDVIELDAASHNKVEDVREIRANVGTVASAGGARRIYILDEAHMLSRAASNALLKTLEEPPEHVHFVLATTEPYKLPATIRSRAQRFDFHPLGSEVLGGHVARIAALEGYELADDGLMLVTRHARGSARDALGLLEQVASLGGGKVEASGVTRALGLADADAFRRLADAVRDQDAPAALDLVASIAGAGADLRRFTADAVEFFRGVFLAQYAPNLEEIIDEPAEVLADWRDQARRTEPADVLRCIDRFGDALVALREGREERLVLELALIRLTRPDTSADPDALLSRLERLEDRVRRLGEQGLSAENQAEARIPESSAPRSPSAARPAEPPVPSPKPPASPPSDRAEAGAPAPPEEDDAPVAEVPAPVEGLDLDAVDRIWPALVARVREDAGPRRHALFRESRPLAVDGSMITLGVGAHLPFHLEQLREDDHLVSVVIAVASELLNGSVTIAFQAEGSPAEPVPAPVVHEKAPNPDDLISTQPISWSTSSAVRW
jgi:DNA polymerase-3 subunit gamma/tau